MPGQTGSYIANYLVGHRYNNALRDGDAQLKCAVFLVRRAEDWVNCAFPIDRDWQKSWHATETEYETDIKRNTVGKVNRRNAKRSEVERSQLSGNKPRVTTVESIFNQSDTDTAMP